MAVWVTRDGQSIEVSDMDDRHLVNAIKYMRRRMIKEIIEWKNYGLNYKINDMAPPIYHEMVEELKDRVGRNETKVGNDSDKDGETPPPIGLSNRILDI